MELVDRLRNIDFKMVFAKHGCTYIWSELHIFGEKIDNFSVFLNFFTANLHQPEYLSWTRCIRELEPKEAKFVVCPEPKS